MSETTRKFKKRKRQAGGLGACLEPGEIKNIVRKKFHQYQR